MAHQACARIQTEATHKKNMFLTLGTPLEVCSEPPWDPKNGNLVIYIYIYIYIYRYTYMIRQLIHMVIDALPTDQ